MTTNILASLLMTIHIIYTCITHKTL